MEQLSGLSSSLNIDSIHADQLIWSKRSLEPSIISQTPHQSYPILRQSPKNDNFLLNHIKPDYGSLGQFITDINLNKDILRQKKKRNQGQQEELEEKRIRQHIQNKNLNKILSSPQVTQQQRNVACKLLIQKTFQDAFGVQINQFYTDQIKPQSEQKKILNISTLAESLDQVLSKKTKVQQQSPNKSLLYMKQNTRKNRSFLKGSSPYQNQKQNQIKKIIQIKNTYRSLQKYMVPEQAPTYYNQMMQKYSSKKTIDLQFQINRRKQSKRLNQPLELSQKLIKIKDREFCLANFQEIPFQTSLFFIAKIHFQQLETFSLVHTSFPNFDVLFLVLDLINKYSRKLKNFTLEAYQQCKVQMNEKVKEKLAQKLKTLIEVNHETLNVLKLNNMQIQTKQFCMLCLGIGSTKNLQKIELKNNKIDQNARKSYQVIVKFFKGLQIDLQGNTLNNQLNNGISKISLNKVNSKNNVQHLSTNKNIKK